MAADFQPPLTRAGEPCKLCSKFGKPCRPEHDPERSDDMSVEQRVADIGTDQPRVDLDEPCERCGTKHVGPDWEVKSGKCNGVKRDHSGLCEQPAGARTSHAGEGRCWLHGGRSPTHVQAAERKAALRACRKFGEPVEGLGPKEALLRLVARCAGDVKYYHDRVVALEPDALTWGIESHRKGRGPEGPVDVKKYSAKVNSLLKLYHEAEERLRRVGRDAARAGVEERKIRIVEETGQLVATAVAKALEARGVEFDEQLRAELHRRLFVVHEQLAIEGEVVDDDGD